MREQVAHGPTVAARRTRPGRVVESGEVAIESIRFGRHQVVRIEAGQILIVRHAVPPMIDA
jgi:hypothetical protein